MTATRIPFQAADPATFNLLRDEWRSAALSAPVSRAGLRVAGVLPSFVSRQHGYVFPTDEDLGQAIGADKKTAKRGLASLSEFRLIERDTSIRRDAKGIVVGKQRRIYLTLPEEKQPMPKGQNDDQPKGQASPKGQNRTTEGTPGCPYTLDYTRDSNFAYERATQSRGTYMENVPSVSVQGADESAVQHTDGSVMPDALASSPPQEPLSNLSAINVPAIEEKPPVPSVRWQDARHPKALTDRPVSRQPLQAPRSFEAGKAFLHERHIPEIEWQKLLPNLMRGELYEFDIEPWMDVA